MLLGVTSQVRLTTDEGADGRGAGLPRDDIAVYHSYMPMKLYPIPQLESPIPVTDESDYWHEFDTVSVAEELGYPKDSDKSPAQTAETEGGGHVAQIRYEETKLRAEGQLFSQTHLARLGVASRPTNPCPFTKSFPMYLIRGADLKRQSRIPRHEDLLARKLLVEISDFRYLNLRAETKATHYVQDPDDRRVKDFGVLVPIHASGQAVKPWKQILFLSHRWLDPLGSEGSPPHPDDPANSKLAMLRKIIDDDDYVMLDYVSFPQDNEADRQKAIQSLSWYVYHCSRFRALVTDDDALNGYLDRGWCQLEMLAAFCPVLSRTEEHSDGNFYLDFETTRIARFFVCASPDRAALYADGTRHPLAFSLLRNPNTLEFTVPTDVQRIQGPLRIVVEALQQSRPRKENVEAQRKDRMTTHQTTTNSYSFEGATEAEHEAALAILSGTDPPSRTP